MMFRAVASARLLKTSSGIDCEPLCSRKSLKLINHSTAAVAFAAAAENVCRFANARTLNHACNTRHHIWWVNFAAAPEFRCFCVCVCVSHSVCVCRITSLYMTHNIVMYREVACAVRLSVCSLGRGTWKQIICTPRTS